MQGPSVASFGLGKATHGCGPAARHLRAGHGWLLSLFPSPAGKLFCRPPDVGLAAAVGTPRGARRGGPSAGRGRGLGGPLTSGKDG